METKEQILNYVKTTQAVSFAELTRLLGNSGVGPYCLCLSGHPNHIFWANMSAEFADAMMELLASGELIAKPTNVLVYLVDGQILNMPLTRGLYAHKKPHWVPIVLNARATTSHDIERGLQEAANEVMGK